MHQTTFGSYSPVNRFDANPYFTPGASLASSETPQVCRRRLDIALIAIVLVAGFVFFLVAQFIRPLREMFHPRLGFTSNMLLYPVVHLSMYLWRPNTRILWGATGMMLFFGRAWRAGDLVARYRRSSHSAPSTSAFRILVFDASRISAVLLPCLCLVAITEC